VTRRALTLVVVWLAGAGTALGQSAAALPGRLEIGAGLVWVGGGALGLGEARLTANEVTPTAPFVWFRTRSAIGAAAGMGVRLSWRLAGPLSVEGLLEVARPRVRTEVTSDVEAPGPILASARMTEYALGGGATVDLAALAFHRGRGRPFVGASAGLLRQRHGEGALVMTGRVYHVGGGVKYALRVRSAGRLPGVGLRFDAALRVRDGGLEVDGRRRPAVAIGGGAFVRF
jgi:hypothetical protein